MTEKTGVCLKTTEIEQYTEGVVISIVCWFLVFGVSCLGLQNTIHQKLKTNEVLYIYKKNRNNENKTSPTHFALYEPLYDCLTQSIIQ